MRLPNSFRGRLALRFGLTVMLLSLGGAAAGYLALHGILYDQLDSSLRRLAEIEAAATADSPDESVHFHDELFVQASSGEMALTRFAEVWTLEGRPVVRTGNLGGRDLPLPDAVRRSVAGSGRAEFFSFTWRGKGYRGLLYSLGNVGPQHAHHLLEVVAPVEQTQSVLRHFLRLLGLLVLSGTLAAYALGWWLAGHAVRPVMEIIRQAESLDVRGVAQGPERRIAAHAETRELSRLVSVLNSMLTRIDSAFETQRRFLADAGHEIKTPLTILRGDIEVALRKRRDPEEYEVVLEQALEDLRGVSSLAEDLITLARSDSEGLQPQRTAVSIEALVARVARAYASAAESRGVQLDLRVEPGLTVDGDPDLLERAVANLVDNAVSYGGRDSRVLISAKSAGNGWAAVSVSDDGPGVPVQERQRLFERFYRGEAGRRSVRGSGLGLAIVKAIVESHGGAIELDSEVGRGTTLRVLLPSTNVTPATSSARGQVHSRGES